MPQQYIYGSYNDKYVKKLYVDTGMSYMEVKALIIEPYSPPEVQPKLVRRDIINAPAHIENMGVSAYTATLTLLFKNKSDYVEYLAFVGYPHKFYDEKGMIYLGSVESVKTSIYEATKKFKVEISLVLVKKDIYDKKDRFEFQDIEGHWAEADIKEMANLGLITVIAVDGTPVLYFRPDAYITRAEYIAFLNRTRRLLEDIVRE